MGISGKDKSKKKSKSASYDSDSSSESDIGPVGRTIQKKKKVMDALFHLKWWRVVLGKADAPSFCAGN